MKSPYHHCIDGEPLNFPQGSPVISPEMPPKSIRLLEKLKLERLKLSFYMSDIFRISTVKTERGLDYPYARTFSFSLSATF